jgi:hypothetical protein
MSVLLCFNNVTHLCLHYLSFFLAPITVSIQEVTMVYAGRRLADDSQTLDAALNLSSLTNGVRPVVYVKLPFTATSTATTNVIPQQQQQQVPALNQAAAFFGGNRQHHFQPPQQLPVQQQQQQQQPQPQPQPLQQQPQQRPAGRGNNEGGWKFSLLIKLAFFVSFFYNGEPTRVVILMVIALLIYL